MQNLFFGIVIILLAVFTIYMLFKNKKSRKNKPGQYLLFECSNKTAAQCKAILKKKENNSIFDYKLENAKNGDIYIIFTKHIPTQQVLETVYMLGFEDEEPAKISMTFIREVFGSKEPVFGEELIEAFFEEKFNAVRIFDFEENI